MRTLLISIWVLAQAGVVLAEAQVRVDAVEYKGDNSVYFKVLEKVRRAPLSDRGVMETRLLLLLDTWKDDIAVVDTVCDALRVVASEASIPEMTSMLLDDAKAVHALQVLQAIDSQKTDAALREALSEVSPSMRIAIVTTLGFRRDPLAVDSIAVVLAESRDADLRSAGLHALGRIGTVDALRILDELDMSPDELRVRDQALLECAYALLEAGSGDAAQSTLVELSERGSTPAVRTGALRGLLLSDPERAIEPLREALADTNLTLSIGAAMVSRVASDPGVTRVLTNALASAPPPLQAAIIGALADRRDSTAGPAILAQLRSENDAVREQAVYATEWIEDPDLLEPLLALARDGSATRDAARFVLGRKPSEEITAGLKARLNEQGADIALLVDLLDLRNAPLDLSQLMAIAERGDPEMRSALGVMSRRAGTNDVSALLDWMDRVPAEDRTRIAGVILDATQDVRNPVTRFAFVFGEADRLADATRADLIAIAPRIGGTAALSALEEAAAGNNDVAQDAALRALCKWSTPDAMAPLNRVLAGAKDERQRILIYRSLVSLIREHVEIPQQQIIALKRLSDNAQRPSEEAVIDTALEAMGGSPP